jgi:dihydroxyacid dehydratase/phosphogluconate dehydratase
LPALRGRTTPSRKSWARFLVLLSNIRPRDIVTRKAIENAAMVVAAAGGSTNGGLHIPAIANEAGIDFDLHAFGEISKRTPLIGDLKPAGRYVMKDLHDIGGVPVLMKAGVPAVRGRPDEIVAAIKKQLAG